MIIETVYEHPDGPAIAYRSGALVASDEDDNFVVIPIGLEGLKVLIKRLEQVTAS